MLSKRLIAINRIQIKVFLYIIYKCLLCIFMYIEIQTHACIYLEKYAVYILNIFIYNIKYNNINI